MSARSCLCFAIALALLPTTGLADVVRPPPLVCPPGHTPSTSHAGPYCAPPLPKDCAPGYEPKVQHKHAYCEPPPEQPCPPGSKWRSTSETRTWCEGGPTCADRDCGEYWTCREEGLCVTPETRWRGETYEVVSTTCNSDADCTGVEETCVKAKRCDPNVKRRAVADAEVAPKPATDPAASGPTPVAEEPGDDEIVQRPGCAVGGAAPAAWLLLLPAALIARRR